MSDEMSYVELDRQHVELLPARTVLSAFVSIFVRGSDGGTGSNGADSVGGIGIGLPILDKIFPGSGNAHGANGGNADGS